MTDEIVPGLLFTCACGLIGRDRDYYRHRPPCNYELVHYTASDWPTRLSRPAGIPTVW